MQTNNVICDCCGKPVEEYNGADLTGTLITRDAPDDVKEIELEDLCIGCSDALWDAIKTLLLRRQEP